MAAATEFRILGPLEVWRGGSAVPVNAPRQRALLAFLLLREGEVVPQDELIEELWGAEPPPSARASLQNQIHGLRQLLGADVVETISPGYRIHVMPGHLDLQRFQALVAEAGSADVAERTARLAEALALWRGVPLAEFSSKPFAQFELWRLEELRLSAIEDRFEAELELGRHAAAVGELDVLVHRHPLRERLWRLLMLALYRSGRQADALAAYRRAHAEFVADLGLEPGPLLRGLQRAILVQDPSLVDAARDGTIPVEQVARLLPGDERRRVQSLIDYASALWRLDERRQSRAALEEAMRLAQRSGERALEERARLRLSWQAMFDEGRGPLEHLAQAERSARVLGQLDDAWGLAEALRWQAHTLRDLGRAGPAVELAGRALEAANSAGDASLTDWCRQMLARSAALGPMPVEEAIVVCTEQANALTGPDPGPRDGIESVLAWLYAQAGRHQEALDLGETVVARVCEAGDRFHFAPNAGFLAWAEVLAGDVTAAADTLGRVVELLEGRDHAAFAVYAADLARVRAYLGEDGEAERLAAAARVTATRDDLYPQVLWRRALALVESRRADGWHPRLLADEAVALTSATDHLTFHGETLEDAAAVETSATGPERGLRLLADALAAYTRKGNVVGAARVQRRLHA